MTNIGDKAKIQDPDQINQVGLGLIDYDYYAMTGKEKAFHLLVGSLFIFLVGFVFYRSLFISSVLCPLSFFYPRIKTTTIITKRKTMLNFQFRDLLYSLSSSVSAGKSIERAFIDAAKDLLVIYPDPEAYINMEVGYILRKLEMNQTVEVALSNLSKRAHLEDMDDFVDVFQTCKRAGGNLMEVIQNTSKIISSKIETKEEINTMISAKKFEQKVLTLMPVFMILLLSISASDYISPVFTTLGGRLIMTITIILLILAYFISKKIMDINV